MTQPRPHPAPHSLCLYLTWIRHVRGGMIRIFANDIHSRSSGVRRLASLGSSSFSNLAVSQASKWVTAGKKRN
ncbi:hypothetical protein E2C01_016176 [Portunus trituberculatus]|uniref:Uncharacterized protein n=1 Tax=Portunus trituberculatus TaxID=210409 RepID=A0A5B7DPV4_PORTR|nr:hypothetical protein [Portunus trituberculatus]